MADYERLINALKFCSQSDVCIGCPEEHDRSNCQAKFMTQAADAIEGLFCENEHLREIVESRAAAAYADQFQKLIHQQKENALLFPAPPAPQRCGPMYIMTNDGKRVFLSSKFGRYSVTSDHCVTATPHRELFFETLGVYSDNGAATAALEGLLYALGSGAPIYRMPPASWQDEIPAWSETVKPC